MKKDTLLNYKIAGIAISLLTMIICQFHYVSGKFIPIVPEKQWWAVITTLMTGTFMQFVKLKLPKAIEHTKGITLLVFLIYAGVSTYLKIPISTVIWGFIGVILGFIIGNSEV
jgi:hypothetical protein